MKKSILFIILVIQSCVLFSQTWIYKAFPAKNAIWVNRTGVDNLGKINWNTPVNYCMDSRDTMINGITYSQVYQCKKKYDGALRDDHGKIYYIPSGSITELLIYDFTVKAGDSISIYFRDANGSYFSKGPCTNFKVDSTMINGSFRKTITIDGSYKWIEGIGNSRGLFVESWANVSGWVNELHCMSENDTIRFPSPGVGKCPFTVVGVKELNNNISIDLYPNPTAGKFEFQLQGVSALEIEIQNVMGETLIRQLVQTNIDLDISAFPAGIYILKAINEQKNVFIKKIIKE